MLALNLAKIRTPHEHFEYVYQPKQLGPDIAETDAYKIVAPVELAFDVFKDKDKFRLAGSAKTTLEMPCSRCLEAFTQPVDAEFDLRYHPFAQNSGEGEREVEEDDLTTAFYQDDVIDLGQLMQEQFYLALPMKPLCTEGCRGLCPTCGTNLNRGTCTCSTRWEDPRFAALKALKRDS
jgi:uncharacterized protein